MKILEDKSGATRRGGFCRSIAAAAIAAALMLSSCKSVPAKEEIPEELSMQELSLQGQNELDKNNYAAAVVYYEVIIERFGSDPRALTAAEYEIAHIRVKQKHWSEAKPMLQRIVARYEAAGGAGLPPEYLVLARNDLNRVMEHEKDSSSEEEN